MTTKNLPTDKNGNVYYGPTTYGAAVSQIEAGREPDDVASMLADAGYAKIAAKITKEFHGVGTKPTHVGLVGRTIVGIEQEYWPREDSRCGEWGVQYIVLDDGTKIELDVGEHEDGYAVQLFHRKLKGNDNATK